jgi:serine/threonine-protein kinase RsbW
VTTRTAIDAAASLALPASLDSLRIARHALQRALRDVGWEPEAASPVVLAAAEAVANAIVHGSTPQSSVQVGLEVTPDHARVRVVDEGRGGPPPVCPVAPPPAESTHGRGLLIMRAVADRCSVRAEGDGTEVVLEFRRAA